MPVRIPDDDPIVAIAVLLLLHVPPGVASLNTADELGPAQTTDGPVIAAGGVHAEVTFPNILNVFTW